MKSEVVYALSKGPLEFLTGPALGSHFMWVLGGTIFLTVPAILFFKLFLTILCLVSGFPEIFRCFSFFCWIVFRFSRLWFCENVRAGLAHLFGMVYSSRNQIVDPFIPIDVFWRVPKLTSKHVNQQLASTCKSSKTETRSELKISKFCGIVHQ